ncbi:putative nuclease HARBI1 [Pleurodeles waltl]|uniref:putative nuclease HARBI1 n=1 Tax=Pleurodeles waltl TaxID=8319 RepID=UPI003709B0E6
MEVLLMQLARRLKAQDQQQQPLPPQRDPQRQGRRHERVFRNRKPSVDLREQDIIRRYRLNWEAIQQLLHQNEPQITASLQTPHNIPQVTKLLAVLRMFASGSFQTTGALVTGVSQPSFSNLRPKVLDALISLTLCHISFPNTQQKQQDIKQEFYQNHGFLHGLSAVDCTHVWIVPPAGTEHLFWFTKHTHSINAQSIVDNQGLFTNILAKYPGSVHDSFIFCHITINQHFQDEQYGNGLLVADQGYGIQPWIMTPFPNQSTAAENAYNEAHRRIRTIVEITFGILKSRLRIQATKHPRGLSTPSPPKSPPAPNVKGSLTAPVIVKRKDNAVIKDRNITGLEKPVKAQLLDYTEGTWGAAGTQVPAGIATHTQHYTASSDDTVCQAGMR